MAPRPRHLQLTLFAVVLGLSSLQLVNAQDAGAVREESDPEYQRLISEGLSAYGDKRYVAARASFARAHSLIPNARTLRGLGVTDFALDDFRSARHELEAALAHAVNPLSAEQRREVEELLAWMQASLTLVRLEYTPAQSVAEIDERRVQLGDLPLEPGKHTLQVRAAGYAPHEQTFQLVLSPEPLHLTVHLERMAPRRVETSSNTWLWLTVGSAVAAVSGGVLFGVGRMQIDAVEDPDVAAQSKQDAESQATRGQWFTAVGGGLAALGVAGLATGLILRLAQDDHEPDPLSFRYRIAPGHVAIAKSF